MKRLKLYLSKSNACDKDELNDTKQELLKYDCEVVEFTGGRYTDQPMMDCDVMLVVGPDGSRSFGNYDLLSEVPVGKGQYEQIKLFGVQKGFSNIFYVCHAYACLDISIAKSIRAESDLRISNMTTNYGVMSTHYTDYCQSLEKYIPLIGQSKMNPTEYDFDWTDLGLKDFKQTGYTFSAGNNLCGEIVLPNSSIQVSNPTGQVTPMLAVALL